MKPAIKRMLIAGIVGTIVPPLLGIAYTIFGMIRAFDVLGKEGISDPSALAQAIASVLIGTWAGLIMGVFGLIVTAVALIIHFSEKAANPSPQPPPA
jgi:biopolymer transport protein ExbB/TolQ